MREPIAPGALVGHTVTAALAGWHELGTSRTKARLFLAVDDATGFEVHTSGNGSLELVLASTPLDFDMGESGSFTFHPAEADDPVQRLFGAPIRAIRPIRWRGRVAGLLLETTEASVVLFNDADEVFVSGGTLPPDYRDANVDG